MFNRFENYFLKPGKKFWDGKKITALIVIIIAILFVLYERKRNEKLANERVRNSHYTIGLTIRQYRNFRAPNPEVKYKYYVFGRQFTSFEEIPNYLHNKIITEKGRYYVQFSSTDPSNCKLMLKYPVPDSVSNAPDSGWTYMPGYRTGSFR